MQAQSVRQRRMRATGRGAAVNGVPLFGEDDGGLRRAAVHETEELLALATELGHHAFGDGHARRQVHTAGIDGSPVAQ